MHVAAALRCATGKHMGFQHRAFEQEGHRLQRPSHVSFGLHPGFAVSSVEQARIILPKGKYRRYLAPDNFLNGEAPYFTIWSDLNPFICVEPCWGLPDHQDQRPFEKKLGIQAIPPKDTLTRRFSMRFS